MSAKIFRGICKQLVDPHKSKLLLTTARSKSQDLREVIASKIPIEQKKIVEFRKAHGKDVIGNVTVNSMYGGMRGVLGFVYETSLLDSDVGIRFRGLSIPDLQEKLPKIDGGEEVQPEGVFWLLMTGDVPTKEQVAAVTDEWNDRGALPKNIISMLKSFPKSLHPMAQLSCAVVALNEGSKFAKGYANKMARTEYWQCAYEDSMDLIAKVTSVAAHIYVNLYKNGKGDFKIDPSDDWTGNFCKMLGYNDPCFTECMRMYLTIHCDHEGGNVSAHAVGLVGSALSDPYLSFAAGMCGLAGPLHGLANQEVLVWLTNMQKIVGENPTKEKIKEFVEQTLKSGQVVPGFGHAVLRVTDPRYTCQREFAMKHLPDYPMFKLVSDIFEVVPPVLKATGKVQNPWPNVDAHSGVLLQYYGMKEMQYYTVLFGVSRAIGVLASLIWNRALGIPLERPKTLTTEALMKLVKDKDKKKC